MIAQLRSSEVNVQQGSHYLLRTSGLDDSRVRRKRSLSDPTGEVFETSMEYAFVVAAIGIVDDCEGLWCNESQTIMLIIIGTTFFALFFISGCGFVIYRIMRRRKRAYTPIPDDPNQINTAHDDWMSDNEEDDDDDDDDDDQDGLRPR